MVRPAFHAASQRSMARWRSDARAGRGLPNRRRITSSSSEMRCGTSSCVGGRSTTPSPRSTGRSVTRRGRLRSTAAWWHATGASQSPRHRASWPAMELGQLQRLMAETYGARDRARGTPATVAWLTEELGELAQAVRKGSADEQLHELGDVLAWLASLADQLGLSLDDAASRYADGCPRCGGRPCTCP